MLIGTKRLQDLSSECGCSLFTCTAVNTGFLQCLRNVSTPTRSKSKLDFDKNKCGRFRKSMHTERTDYWAHNERLQFSNTKVDHRRKQSLARDLQEDARMLGEKTQVCDIGLAAQKQRVSKQPQPFGQPTFGREAALLEKRTDSTLIHDQFAKVGMCIIFILCI